MVKKKKNKAKRLTAFAEFEKIKSHDVGAVRLNFIWMMQRNVFLLVMGFPTERERKKIPEKVVQGT